MLKTLPVKDFIQKTAAKAAMVKPELSLLMNSIYNSRFMVGRTFV